MHYVLHRLSERPMYAYEILQDIEDKTDGAWRPGPGSIYPLIKKLLREGLVEEEHSGKKKKYRVTAEGRQYADRFHDHFKSAGQKWNAARKIFIEMIRDTDLESLVVDSSRAHFELVRSVVEPRVKTADRSELTYLLREHSLTVERHLEWVRSVLAGLDARVSEVKGLGENDGSE